MNIPVASQGNTSEHVERRRHRRYAVDAGSLQVSWFDKDGKIKSARSRAFDISERGISLQLPEAGKPLLVRFQSDRFKVEGVGAVRHCFQSGAKYVVGLEFTEGLRWSVPDADVREPIVLTRFPSRG
jgi:PilZ domain